MKRALIFNLTILVSVVAMCQDVIVTMDAKKIEAKILEVSKTEIKYKEMDNLEGPTFVLEVEEISSVIYANGKVVLYNQNAQSAPKSESNAVSENIATILLLSGNTITVELLEMNSKYVAYSDNGERKTIPASQINTVTLPNGQVKKYSNTISESEKIDTLQNTTMRQEKIGGRIYRDNGNYLYNDTYIGSKEVERILQRENTYAYEEWKKANGMLVGAAVCTGIGGGLVIGGLFSLITQNYNACIGIECAALPPLIVGLGLSIGSSHAYTKAIDIYNSKYDQAAVQLKYGVSVNGIGLAIAF